MSKKRFSEGLDNLFYDSPVVMEEAGKSVAYSERVGGRAAHGKNFVSDLDALLQEALDESSERYESRQASMPGKSKSASAQGGMSRPVLSGLDALIRQTIDVRELGVDELGKKRLTVAVDKPKLDRLKSIARLENAYLKDILVGLIDEYLDKYGRERGV